jgi:mRNA interferase RelE/StbE
VENFTVRLSRRAEKQLLGLPKSVRRAVGEALLEMEIDPYAGDYKKLKGGEGHRRRIGQYRILYEIDTGFRLVSIYGILHRREAYR